MLAPTAKSPVAGDLRRRNAHVALIPDSKVHGANMGPTWVLSAPDGPHAGSHEPCYQGCCLGYDGET